MSFLASIILIAVLLFLIMGAVQLAFWLIVGSVIYLCICAIIEKIESWLKQ
jgi:hypothetical protein